MIIALALVFLAVGVAVIANTIFRTRPTAARFIRFGEPTAGRRRLWSFALGAVVASAGITMLLISRADSLSP